MVQRELPAPVSSSRHFADKQLVLGSMCDNPRFYRRCFSLCVTHSVNYMPIQLYANFVDGNREDPTGGISNNCRHLIFHPYRIYGLEDFHFTVISSLTGLNPVRDYILVVVSISHPSAKVPSGTKYSQPRQFEMHPIKRHRGFHFIFG